ncbi:MAG: inorganic diphosphatase [Candidatus Saccharibacteria bacterium]
MINFDQILNPGDIDNGIVNVVVEIPTGSNNKIEWNRDEEIMQLDRIESMAEPANYGFIPHTLGGDGDELDVIIINDKPLPTETCLKARVIGVMYLNDEGDKDDKIIVVPEGASGIFADIINISDISKEVINKITYHFNNYKSSQKSEETTVTGWGNSEDAKKIIINSIKLWNNSENI